MHVHKTASGFISWQTLNLNNRLSRAVECRKCSWEAFGGTAEGGGGLVGGTLQAFAQNQLYVGQDDLHGARSQSKFCVYYTMDSQKVWKLSLLTNPLTEVCSYFLAECHSPYIKNLLHSITAAAQFGHDWKDERGDGPIFHCRYTGRL